MTWPWPLTLTAWQSSCTIISSSPSCVCVCVLFRNSKSTTVKCITLAKLESSEDAQWLIHAKDGYIVWLCSGFFLCQGSNNSWVRNLKSVGWFYHITWWAWQVEIEWFFMLCECFVSKVTRPSASLHLQKKNVTLCLHFNHPPHEFG